MAKYLSTGVTMAWQLAARIAVSLNHEYIEKEHIFAGIFSLEKLVQQGSVAEGKKKVDISDRSRIALEEECGILQEVLDDYKVTFEQLRKGILIQMRPGKSKQAENTIHRNYNCKLIFMRAEMMAKAAGSKYYSCLHLLAILMDSPGVIIENALANLRILPRQFRQKICTVANRTNVYATAFDTGTEVNTCFMFPQEKKKPLTIIAGEVVGSKDLIETLGELQLCCLLEDLNQLVRMIVDRHGCGEIIDPVEQGLLVVFSSPKKAVKSTFELQKSIPPHDELKMSFGLDRGVIKRQESGRAVDVSGESVLLARKLAKSTGAGDILASENVIKQVGDTISGGITWEPAGTCTSEPGKEPVYVYRATTRKEAADL